MRISVHYQRLSQVKCTPWAIPGMLAAVRGQITRWISGQRVDGDESLSPYEDGLTGGAWS